MRCKRSHYVISVAAPPPYALALKKLLHCYAFRRFDRSPFAWVRCRDNPPSIRPPFPRLLFVHPLAIVFPVSGPQSF